MGAFNLLSDYANDDTNIQNMQQTLTASFKNGMSISLTEMDTTTIPAIEEGSWVEDNGSLYYANDGDVEITDNDPVTDAQVADGTVYLCLVPDIDSSGGILEAAFTATTPVWSGSKQGAYVDSVGFENYRIIARAIKSGNSYTFKEIIHTQDQLRVSKVFAYAAASVASANIIVFGTEVFDIAGDYNNSTGVFTAPYDGYYHVSYNVRTSLSSSPGFSDVSLRINSSIYIQDQVYGVTNSKHSLSCLIKLEKDFTVDVYANQNISGIVTTNKASSFSIYKV